LPDLFDPALWLVLPSGGALYRPDLVPCRQCGGTRFRVTAPRPGRPMSTVGCPACSRSLRRDDVTVGWVDVTRGVFEPATAEGGGG
jgi:hypothetical protein